MNGDNLVGEVLDGRYDILEKIGTGGMATVYKAKDRVLDRNVAIKILRDSLEGEDAVVNNFINEARASAGLVHNNIVSVYDVGETDGLSYMVMELVDGITLKEYIREKGALPWQEACDYAIQIAQGISEAHSNNIIHCDIKPQNIIMTEDKTVKVTDFGIAKAVSSGTTVVSSGDAMGSVHYISPEQARGGFTDPRSDIYSMGIVMYEMLAGRVPFDGDSAVGIAMKHLEETPTSVKCINIDVPQDLDYIVMKAISKERNDRYDSVHEMLDDLHAVLASEPLPSRGENVPAEDLHDDMDNDAYEDISRDAENTLADNQKRLREQDELRIRENEKRLKNQKKANRTATWLAIVTVIVVILLGVGTYFTVNNLVLKASVPDFSNMTVEEAKTLAAKNNLVIDDADVEYSISDTVEKGKIIIQDPEKGTAVDKNSNIKVVVSIGARGGNIAVPDLTNKTRNEALEAINASNLKATVIEEASNTVPAGNVIRQTPVVGTKLFADDYVTIYVSKGIQGIGNSQTGTVTVPDVRGVDIDVARNTLTADGLTLGNVSVSSSEEPYGTVIEQTIEPGRTVNSGTSVGIVISGGTYEEAAGAAEEQASQNTGDSSTDSADTGSEESASVGNEEASENGGQTDSGTGSSDSYTSTSSSDSDTSTSSSDSSAGSGTKTFFVSIPSDTEGDAEVEVYVNGSLVHEGTYPADAGTIPVDITGSGEVNVTAYVNGVAQSQSINFGN